MQRVGAILVVLALLLTGVPASSAQGSDLVAVLEVIEAGVEVRRAGVEMWAPVNVESLVGVGDAIRTDDTGQARITFFQDGAFTELTPNTEYHILTFRGDEARFNLKVEVLTGIVMQQFARLLDPASSYEVLTPGMAMTVRGTDFAIRVEDDGRSALLTYEGLVAAEAGGTSAPVNPGFGVRAAVQEELSAVVPATTFEELDAALDGCAGRFETDADVRLNVRVGPGLEFGRVGSIDPQDISHLVGVDETGTWYRFPYNQGYAWVNAHTFDVTTCEVLRRFSLEDFETEMEDVGLYTDTGEVAELGVQARIVARNPVVNFRVGPGTGYVVADQLENGSPLRITGRNREQTWYQVLLPDGRVGWVAAFLIESPIEISQYRVIPMDTLDAEDVPPPGVELDDAAADG
ncbi:MAG: SH3 domain-containing protein [Anaerolineae bacterium]|nr:SH3 domain-containing protein [Anaerolineae bacterium]